MNKFLLSIVYLLLAVLPLSAQEAKDVPPRPNPPRLVNDLAGLLRPEEVAALEQKLVAYNDSTSTQIAIVNVSSIGPYDIFAYAHRLAETWGIGQKDKNNGIIILTAVKERKVIISTGYGMEAVVPDAIAKRITEYTLKPNYKAGNYYQGLNEATDFIIDVASGQYKADPRDTNRSNGGDSPIMFWLIIGFLALIILINLRKRGGGGRGGRGGGMRTLGGPFFPPVIFGDFSSGRGPFGGGGFGGGGGGFGGFGGGSFGGGGASSDW